MIFDNRTISEITDQDLINLIGNQEENLWIDFKQQDYHNDPNDTEKHKREICKDVTAMANAEGGYIIIGISETNKIAQDFFPINEAAKLAQSINDICLQHIDPRIPNLEVKPYTVKWKNKDIKLVIIHIPPSGMRPHSFIWKNSTNFVKRYGDVVREFPVSELIQDLLTRYRPPYIEPLMGQIGQIERQLTSIVRGTQRERMNSISSEDDPLDVEEDNELKRIMKLRFDETISDQPYYRIFAMPKQLDRDAIDIQNENIHNVLQNPPNIRRTGFGVTGMLGRDRSISTERIEGSNMGSGEIILLKNGFLEVQCPLSNSHFQWMHDQSGLSTPWLYPHVVCEFPVSFLKLLKGIYEVSGINSSIFVQQEYHNLENFVLIGGNPSNPIFGRYADNIKIYQSSRPIVSERTIESEFVPDHVAYDLVKELYKIFGLDAEWIPDFDEEGNFTLR